MVHNSINAALNDDVLDTVVARCFVWFQFLDGVSDVGSGEYSLGFKWFWIDEWGYVGIGRWEVGGGKNVSASTLAL